MVDKVKGGVKRGCVHFDTPSPELLKSKEVKTIS